jgi:hypothetical protein
LRTTSSHLVNIDSSNHCFDGAGLDGGPAFVVPFLMVAYPNMVLLGHEDELVYLEIVHCNVGERLVVHKDSFESRELTLLELRPGLEDERCHGHAQYGVA